MDMDGAKSSKSGGSTVSLSDAHVTRTGLLYSTKSLASSQLPIARCKLIYAPLIDPQGTTSMAVVEIGNGTMLCKSAKTVNPEDQL